MKTVKPLKWHVKGNDSLSQTLILLLQTEFEISNLDYFKLQHCVSKINLLCGCVRWQIFWFAGLGERRENTRLNPDFYKLKWKEKHYWRLGLKHVTYSVKKKINDDSPFIVKKHPEKVLNLEVLICYIFIFYSLFVANYVSVVTALNK